MKHLFSFIASAALLSSSAWAQSTTSKPPSEAVAARPVATKTADSLRSELTISQVVVSENGAESLRSASQVKPNDLLQYTATYVNTSSSPVQRLVASLPIPVGMQWVSASALPLGVTASTDEKVFLRLPLTRQIKQADGRVVTELIPLSEYRALRWPEHTLAAGSTYTVSTRVRVNSLGSAAASSTAASQAVSTAASSSTSGTPITAGSSGGTKARP